MNGSRASKSSACARAPMKKSGALNSSTDATHVRGRPSRPARTRLPVNQVTTVATYKHVYVKPPGTYANMSVQVETIASMIPHLPNCCATRLRVWTPIALAVTVPVAFA